ncbi:hypothetical protein JCM8097_008393 [Rhodosporidiobolus ruineniae]
MHPNSFVTTDLTVFGKHVRSPRADEGGKMGGRGRIDETYSNHPTDPALLPSSHRTSTSSSSSTRFTPSLDSSLAQLVLERHRKHPNKTINWAKIASGLDAADEAEGRTFGEGEVEERWEALKREVSAALNQFYLDPTVGLVAGENGPPFTPTEDSLLLAAIFQYTHQPSSSSSSAPPASTSTLSTHPHTAASSLAARCIVRERTRLGQTTPDAARSLAGRSLGSLFGRWRALEGKRGEVRKTLAMAEGNEEETEEWEEEEKQAVVEKVVAAGGNVEALDGGWEDDAERTAHWVMVSRDEDVGEGRSVAEVLLVWEEKRIEVWGNLLQAYISAPHPVSVGTSTISTGAGDDKKKKDAASDVPASGGRYSHWTPSEDALLRQLKAQNLTWRKVAEQLPGRSWNTCSARYSAHKKEWMEKGLLNPPPTASTSTSAKIAAALTAASTFSTAEHDILVGSQDNSEPGDENDDDTEDEGSGEEDDSE